MPTTAAGVQLGYARVSTDHQSLDQQLDALAAAGVQAENIHKDVLSGTSTREQRPGSLAALLAYARPGDTIVVVGIDRLGRNAAEVMSTIRDLGERDIVLRSRCARASTRPPPPGGWWPGCWPAWPSWSWSWQSGGSAARDARRARARHVGRPKALGLPDKAALARRMHAATGEPVKTSPRRWAYPRRPSTG